MKAPTARCDHPDRRSGSLPAGRVAAAELPNGVRVIVETTNHARVSAVGLYVRGGSTAERQGERGFTHALEHLLMQHKLQSGLRVAEQLDAWGWAANAETAKEYLALYATGHTDLVVPVLSLLAAALSGSLEEDVWDAERDVVLDEIAQWHRSARCIAVDGLYAALFGPDALAMPTVGDHETVASVSVEELARFRARTVFDASVAVVVTGAASITDVVAAVGTSAIADLPPRTAQSPKPPADREGASKRQIIEAHTPDGVACVCIGGRSVDVQSSRRLLDDVAVAAIAGSATSSLYRRIRSELGLAYAVTGHTNHLARTGLWHARIVTAREDVAGLVGAVEAALAELAGAPPDLALATAARECWLGQQLLMTETAYERMSGYAYHRFIGGEESWTRELDVAATAALPPEEIARQVARFAYEWSLLSIALPEGPA